MAKSNKSILIVTLYYYPDNRVGAKRFGNLAKFFTDYFEKVHVLTVAQGQVSGKDPSLSPAGIVHRAAMLPPYPMDKNKAIKRVFVRLWEKYLCTLDHYSGWLLPALIEAIKVIKTEKIDIVIATGPPFTAMLVGALASLATGKKLILDYRDPWTTLPSLYPPPFGKMINIAAEKLSTRLASGTVFCSTLMQNDFLAKFGRQGSAPCHVLTNGYMEPTQAIAPLRHSADKITMLYAGNLYRGRGLGLIAAALSNLIRKEIIHPDNFEFIIYGQIQAKDDQIIAAYQLDQYITVRSAIPYQEILRYMKGADILFLPSAKEVRYAIPYKFFDYLMVNRPILAVAPTHSAVEEVMRSVPFGRFCPIGDTVAIERALAEMIHDGCKGTSRLEEDYTWKTIAKKYAGIIDELSFAAPSCQR
jgi:glycosyltransferase involved in cell wall biosynthesis